MAKARKVTTAKTDKEFAVAFAAIEDSRRIIAAGKVQRWDVVKWAVTVHLALSTAATALGDAPKFFAMSALVSVGAGLLVWLYNRRVTAARELATTLVRWLKRNDLDYDAILKMETEKSYSIGWRYDQQELTVFALILAASPFVVLIPSLFKKMIDVGVG